MRAINTLGVFGCLVLGWWGIYVALEWFAVATVRFAIALLGG